MPAQNISSVLGVESRTERKGWNLTCHCEHAIFFDLKVLDLFFWVQIHAFVCFVDHGYRVPLLAKIKKSLVMCIFDFTL